MMGHNISFKGVIWKLTHKLSLLPLVIWSTECNIDFCLALVCYNAQMGKIGLTEFLSVTNCYVSLHIPVLHVAGIHVT